MELRGIQKVAMLLTALDPATASELLKGQPQEVIHKVALELSHLDAKGMTGPENAAAISKEFIGELQKRIGGTLHVKSFVTNLLQSSAGKDKISDIQSRLKKAAIESDPFIVISNAPAEQIASAVGAEPPQAIAIVISALPSKLGTEVLTKLDEQLSAQVIWRMTMPIDVSPKTLHRVGEVVCKRITEMSSEQQSPAAKDSTGKDTLRKLALVLSGLHKDRREALLQQIQGRNDNTALMIRSLMITWEDIPKIDDKCLQGLLRKIEAGILAKALHGADALVTQKIRSNISERLSQMIDDELSLLGEPRKKDIFAAREEVAKPLREANEAEELVFVEEE
jgi:flagellar motor switch protein FliG